MTSQAKYSHYFESDPDWEQFSKSQESLALKTEAQVIAPFDLDHDRKAQAIDERAWSISHPLRNFGYSTRFEKVKVRDGQEIAVKIYSPLIADAAALPLLFVIHGGGWVQGSVVTEEAWLLWQLFPLQHFLIVSLEYRLAPEHRYPTYVNDCWDVLQDVLKRSQALQFSTDQVFLAGSSAGGSLAAVLSQKARDAKIPIKGVILNVPVTCHPKFFPTDKYEYTSYEQCFGTLLGSREMEQVWEMVVPDPEDGKDPQASPLLGNLNGLPPHLVFVAGQDPLRDEGLAYVEKLRECGVHCKCHIYPGVPHAFGEFWNLEATKRFWVDLVEGVKELLKM